VGAGRHNGQHQAKRQDRVGVKADYKPFGYTDPSGKIVGLEIDLANDVAKRLGVSIETGSRVAANRMEFVKQGRIDMMIATMAYKPDRAEVLAIPQPFYYAGAANVFAKKSSGLKAWADLKGKPVCAIQGAYYNRKTGEEFGAQLVVFKGVTEAMAALEGGNCVGHRVRHDVLSPASWAMPSGPITRWCCPRSIPNPGGWACARKTRNSPRSSAT